MRILILGATGSIGAAVAAELKTHDHQVLCLARSDTSDQKLRALGYETLRGDLRTPQHWCHVVHSVNVIIQLATTWTPDMGEVDFEVLEALRKEAEDRRSPRFLYTGGCWLYGATEDAIATEATPFRPIKAFSWMVHNARHLLDRCPFSAAIVHPASVYHKDGGVFRRFIESARANDPVQIWGSPHVRWPLIHRDDLAVVYRLLAERADLVGHFNASAEQGVRVEVIAAAIAEKFGNSQAPIVKSAAEVIAQYGAWAEGPMLDQQMSSERLEDKGWQPKIRNFATSDLFGASNGQH
ncbi:MAG: NAD-dependent epimerase/dehydratase family protein [Hyphomicrobiaceae bacterium]|nr:NAD-dependent epimerase/dehydratase family protein [Hyphomicrobiaceae bacterium]